MRTKEVNEIVLSREQHGDRLWEEVANILRILTKNEEICVVYDDDVDVIVIQHEHKDKGFGGDYWGVVNPYWLEPEDVEYLESREEIEEDNDNKDNE